jgi:hypothetical protein
MNSLTNDDAISEDFMDPIFLTVMTNPVVLSSGVTMDHSTAFKDNKFQFTKCPFTNTDLKNKAYPLNCLRAEIVDFTKKRFDTALTISKTYKNDPEKFQKATEAAEKFLLDLGEETYSYQAK